MSTLAQALHNLHTATELATDAHRRRQYALAARDSAAEVLLDPQTTDTLRHRARDCFRAASALLATDTTPQVGTP